MPQPIIGLTLDSEESGSYSRYPWYALRANYCGAVATSGGLAVCLPHEPAAAAEYAAKIDGLIVTGGAFDVDPSLFGDASKHPSVKTKNHRTNFEASITRAMLQQNKPVLGICGGQQLLNVILGGTLIQHIPEVVENALLHEQPNPRHEPGHRVAITPDSLLHRICGTDMLEVNSAHHQAVKETGAGVAVNALAPDGVVEGIEDPRYRFCLGVQWHPEFLITEGDVRIFAAFIAAARG